ncbi:MAG: hypothetical protein RR982_06840 [Kiritimatiellia bacterium]
MTVEMRDRWVLWSSLSVLGVALLSYFILDFLGALPMRYSMRDYARRRAHPPTQLAEFDPDLVLGIPIGDTRFRLNWHNHHAIVMRPLMKVEEWVIPESFVYQGTTFTVTALDTFALLNAPTVRYVSLPPSIVYMNDAQTLMEASVTLVTRPKKSAESSAVTKD